MDRVLERHQAVARAGRPSSTPAPASADDLLDLGLEPASASVSAAPPPPPPPPTSMSMAQSVLDEQLAALGLADADLPRGAGVADLLLPVARSLVTNGRSDEFQVQSKSTHLMAFN